MRLDPPGLDWEALIETADDAFRWEQQPFYASDLETGCPQRWAGGDRRPAEYIAGFVRDVVVPLVAEGRTRQRVRVVDDPMTLFQMWADDQANINRDAGEPIWTVTRDQAGGLPTVRGRLVDWWLLNHGGRWSVLFLHHDTDGHLGFVEHDDSVEATVACAQARDAALDLIVARA